MSHVHSFVVSIVPRKWRFPRIKLVVEGMTDLNVGDIVFLQRKTIFKIEMFVVDIQIENIDR